ncbi:MAG: hypothetical protein V7K68_07775 [Nostoc sp.]|uniref:hypothetical protein n=1 Tax=Nostoc sp. TaxID=1180 RepID=UPI002FFBC93F
MALTSSQLQPIPTEPLHKLDVGESQIFLSPLPLRSLRLCGSLRQAALRLRSSYPNLGRIP